ncbi:MAG: hypothetical protein ABF289_07225 [Clostridiales bacterium]
MNSTIKLLIFTNLRLFLRPVVIIFIVFIIPFLSTEKLISKPYDMGFTQILFLTFVLLLTSDNVTKPFKKIMLCTRVNRWEYFRAKFYFGIIIFFSTIIISTILDFLIMILISLRDTKVLQIESIFLQKYLNIYPIYFLISILVFGVIFYKNFSSGGKFFTITSIILCCIFIMRIFMPTYILKRVDSLKLPFKINTITFSVSIFFITIFVLYLIYHTSYKKYLKSNIL